MLFLLRTCCATLSAFIFVLYVPNPADLLYRLSPYWNCWGDYCQSQRFWYESLSVQIRVITATLWMVSWALLEIRSHYRRFTRPAPKLLTHLRYGPIAVLILSFVTIPISDVLMIQHSHWEMIRYVHSDAPVTERPSLKLHNNYRGWCGNGWSASEYWLYGDAAAAYIDDSDPAIRARSLQLSMYVYDWINNPGDGPSIAALKKALADPDPTVRDIAARFNAELDVRSVR
jgi:hypothetical protein